LLTIETEPLKNLTINRTFNGFTRLNTKTAYANLGRKKTCQPSKCAAPSVVRLRWRKTKTKSTDAPNVEKSSISLPLSVALKPIFKDTSFSWRSFHLALLAFLAQASLQYFFLLSNVVKVFLQTGHFLSIQIPFIDILNTRYLKPFA
jgi:hypothetical protein